MGTIALILCFGVVIWVLLWSTLQKGGQTPPGPTGLPVLGYLPFMGSRPHLLLQKLAKIYGSIFSLRLGSQNLIILDDLSFVKKILLQQRLLDETPEEEMKDNFRFLDYINCQIQQTIIEWLLLAMATYKDVHQKIHEATKETRNNWLSIKYPQLSHTHTIIKGQRSTLTYVKAAILELLRWRPPFPLGILGVTRTDIVLDGYFIPKESLMIANTWSILHDVECWGDDADAYNPERFLNQKGNLKAECLLSLFTGKNLQLNRNIVQPDMLRNFLSILHKFNISLFDGKSSDMEGELFMRLVPKEQELILTIRN
ncbi:Cytochrome P450 1A5 like protein [Argiope bruennichi]|uniref:Cytochrome P450 1A5 like protein n=1 Tax=Argiope bruennichi TaxID=94029 RepID=A0A8T0FN47_ARGBR|nr:Cytochrome P450 1A5 like protein [Argiope bruennichi]